MKMHRAEEIWLIIGVAILVISMAITGYQAFVLGMRTPSGLETIDPQKVDETATRENLQHTRAICIYTRCKSTIREKSLSSKWTSYSTCSAIHHFIQ
ncbi:hypothetical protein [Psychrobacillus antarcticus]|uniref:hypothetical protein n=1 Tax=Psychrobacillus antarcticus TaxID=2879115 RepID=UPI002407AF2E|nr:hypothetical protein [Psychrobacillus antarcticus]